MGYELFHTVAEDAGMSFGIAIKQILKNKIRVGVEGRGSAFGLIDEALALVNLSFESRGRSTIIAADVRMPEMVETTQSANLSVTCPVGLPFTFNTCQNRME